MQITTLKYLFIAAAGLVVFLPSCKRPDTLFQLIPASQSGVDFNNLVTENDSINPLDMEYLYNGGGVAIGDFNNDGNPDLYFTASQTSNRMYLNQGNMEFKDVTDASGTAGEGRWSNGATVVDINNDGLDDIYVCTSIKTNPGERQNLLYINQGKNASGIPIFKEMATQYNLADTGFSVQSAFFDYDRDGDLDVYVATTSLAQRNSTRFDRQTDFQKEKLFDKLYQNQGSDSLGHPIFRDVSVSCGIRDEGYALGIAVADINNDGWKDIYVTNDFNSSDLLYINNHDGTFTDQARTSFKHTSQNAMGNDVADINNDGLEDIIAVDMNPEDNFRKKKNMSPGNYYVYQSMLSGDYVLQYVRNTLQLNNGSVFFDSSTLKLPVFSEIAFYAGVAETDWSWNPSLADFDNDGFKDLIITNGYPKDVTDHDFAAFRAQSSQTVSKKQLLEQIPQIKIPNYGFRNTRDLKFANATHDWGLETPSFSCGAAYADLDNDGDLDYVISNINDKAFLYRNRTQDKAKKNYIQVHFKGSKKNTKGVGAVVELFYRGEKQRLDNSPSRGYLSSVASSLHFGLGDAQLVDSIFVYWPDGKTQVLRNVVPNKSITFDYSEANISRDTVKEFSPLFTDVSAASGIGYLHEEFDYIDFDKQKLIPRRLSQFGPSIAIGDIDENGLDDVFIGASGGRDAAILSQFAGGKFKQGELSPPPGRDIRKPEMLGSILFDCEGDGDLDLYVASGSNEFFPNTKNYQDRLYINKGKGDLQYDSVALPKEFTSKSCVKAADFDQDGDLDIFVGGRVLPEKYPEPVSSFLYRNDSKPSQPKFTDISATAAPFLKDIGLVCDALWSDFNNDGWMDLVVVGEWMSMRFFQNKNGQFSDETESSGIQNKKGWFGSITGGDFDNDGDIDYICGNLGLNSFFKASEKEPVRIYGGDLNNDNAYDAIPSLFLPDEKGNRKEFPVHVRDEMVQQIVGIRKKFNKYTDYAKATIHEIIPTINNARKLEANYFPNSIVTNHGNGKFTMTPLPAMVQFAPLYGMIAEDLNSDGNLDLILSGNDYGNEISNGHYDAFNGAVLIGDGQNNFRFLSIEERGFLIHGDGKALAPIQIGNQYALVASQNKERLKIFATAARQQVFRFRPSDVKATIILKSGKRRSHELYHGSSSFSQGSKLLLLNDSIKSIQIADGKGRTRILNF